MKRPFALTGITALLLSAVSLYCGVLLLIAIAGVFALLLVIIFAFVKKHTFKNSNIVIVLAVCLLLTASCIFNISCIYTPTEQLEGYSGRLDAVVISEPENHGDVDLYTLKGNISLLEGSFKCTILTDCADFNIGDRVSLAVKCKPLEPEYKNSSLAEGIFVSAELKRIISVEKDASLFYTLLGKIRSHIKDTVRNLFKDNIGGVLIALLTGENSYISDALYENTKTCGVTHILVVSGLHISILGGLLGNTLNKARINRKLSFLILIFFFILLIAVCNFHTSAIRSVIMSVIILSGPLLKRRSDSFNSLGLAVTLMIFVNPFLSGSVSFLLSVFATFGVVYLTPRILYLLKPIRLQKPLLKPFNALIDTVVITLSAALCILPITTYYFGYFTLLSIPVNLLIGFAVETALITVALGALISAIPFLKIMYIPLIFISGIAVKYIIVIINYFTQFKLFVIDVNPSLANGLFATLCLGIFMLDILYYLKKSKERKSEDAA